MQYVGGKSAIASSIVYTIERYRHSRSIWIEPFVGGGAVLKVAAKYYTTCYAYDLHPDLIMMYQALQQGWMPPTFVSEAEHKALRHAEPSALRAFVRFGCSFGGNFTGGYARNTRGDDYTDQSRRSLLQMNIENTIFIEQSFFCIDWQQFKPHDCVIYCDPPYAGTYDYSVGRFDHIAFWTECERLHSLGFLIFVSEYNAPESWSCIWQKDVPLQVNGGAKANARKERLFIPELISTPYYMDITAL